MRKRVTGWMCALTGWQKIMLRIITGFIYLVLVNIIVAKVFMAMPL